jgi:hypothetical protein
LQELQHFQAAKNFSLQNLQQVRRGLRPSLQFAGNMHRKEQLQTVSDFSGVRKWLHHLDLLYYRTNVFGR